MAVHCTKITETGEEVPTNIAVHIDDAVPTIRRKADAAIGSDVKMTKVEIVTKQANLKH